MGLNITANKKSAPKDALILVCQINGRGGGIRTHGTLSRTPVFKTGALNRSATPPNRAPNGMTIR